MALPASGTISLNDIKTLFDGVTPINISDYYRGGIYTTPNNLSVPTSGAISISNFYGATAEFTATLSSNATNVNLRAVAVSQGWDQITPLNFVVASGVYAYSNSTGTAGLIVSGTFANGLKLTNNGFIVGKGGNGGNGGRMAPFDQYGSIAGSGGSSGGIALTVLSPLTLYNAGTIGGGGGGGSGGFGGPIGPPTGFYPTNGGGGGGGQGLGSGGAGVSTGSGWGEGPSDPGTAGTLSAAGSGGGPNGPAGGTYGVAGGAGGGYGVGAAGPAINGNSYITYAVTGTILGSVS